MRHSRRTSDFDEDCLVASRPGIGHAWHAAVIPGGGKWDPVAQEFSPAKRVLQCKLCPTQYATERLPSREHRTSDAAGYDHQLGLTRYWTAA